MKRLTQEYVINYLRTFGYILLSKKYINSTHKIQMICPKGHLCNASFMSFKNNSGACKKCGVQKTKLKKSDVIKQLADRGFIMLSENYVNSRTKLHLQCSQGHEVSISLGNVKSGTGCKYCTIKNKKLSLSIVRQRAKEIGFKVLSKSYTKADAKLLFECKKKHKFYKTFSGLQQHKKCPKCSLEKRAFSYEYVKKVVEDIPGYKLISKSYKNKRTKLEIECDRSHRFKTSISSITSGSRCLQCFRDSKQPSYEQVKNIVESIPGYILLSDKYINCRTKLKIQCDKGHLWETRFGGITSGSRCRKCSLGNAFNKEKPGSVYYAKVFTPIGNFYKIGVTNLSPYKRLSRIRYKTNLLWHKPYLFGFMAYEEEQKILKKHEKFRYKGDILKNFCGYTELFTKDVLKKDIIEV